MSDTIIIEGLQVFTRIGVPEDERANAQKLEISITFPLANLKKAARLDDIGLTVDYFQVAQLAKSVAHERPRKLIETLAEDLAAAILRQFAVKWVGIEIRKFILPDARHVSVRIKRKGEKPGT
ncbi:MAG: dihydroneopterin aldolase [Methylacidiphilales bacterium]|nr:dihydroneopterin aldolase [Candidatus Methylacidiphilales bacterium]